MICTVCSYDNTHCPSMVYCTDLESQCPDEMQSCAASETCLDAVSQLSLGDDYVPSGNEGEEFMDLMECASPGGDADSGDDPTSLGDCSAEESACFENIACRGNFTEAMGGRFIAEGTDQLFDALRTCIAPAPPAASG